MKLYHFFYLLKLHQIPVPFDSTFLNSSMFWPFLLVLHLYSLYLSQLYYSHDHLIFKPSLILFLVCHRLKELYSLSNLGKRSLKTQLNSIIGFFPAFIYDNVSYLEVLFSSYSFSQFNPPYLGVVHYPLLRLTSTSS